MTNLLKFLPAIATVSLLWGCAATPNIDEMKQLNADEIKQLRLGNTYAYKADWGTWREFTADDLTGAAQASGGFPTESATSVSTVSHDGEWCTVYAGEADWSQPQFEYCIVMVSDAEGNYLAKNTKNDRRPEQVGTVRKVKILPGDEYKLIK